MIEKDSVTLTIYFHTNDLPETVGSKRVTRPVWSNGVVFLPKKDNAKHKLNFEKEKIQEHFVGLSDLPRAVGRVLQIAKASLVVEIREKKRKDREE